MFNRSITSAGEAKRAESQSEYNGNSGDATAGKSTPDTGPDIAPKAVSASHAERYPDAGDPTLIDQNQHRRRLLSLAAVMVAVIISAAGVSLSMLYRAELDQQADLLRELAQSEARLIKTVTAAHAVDLGPSETPEKSLARLVDGLAQRLPKAEFGNSGDFILAGPKATKLCFRGAASRFCPVPILSSPCNRNWPAPPGLVCWDNQALFGCRIMPG